MKKLKKMIWIFILGLFLGSCSFLQKQNVQSNENLKIKEINPPKIHLVSFMVPEYDGFWYYSKKIKPTKGEPGDRGAPLPMNFVFEIANPNPFPIQLNGFRFTVSVEGFDLITVNDNNLYWIPAKRIDHISITTMITVRSALLNLLVTGGFKLKKMGRTPWQALERWWEKLPLLEIPVIVKDGRANFEAFGLKKVATFSDFYPKE